MKNPYSTPRIESTLLDGRSLQGSVALSGLYIFCCYALYNFGLNAPPNSVTPHLLALPLPFMYVSRMLGFGNLATVIGVLASVLWVIAVTFSLTRYSSSKLNCLLVTLFLSLLHGWLSRALFSGLAG